MRSGSYLLHGDGCRFNHKVHHAHSMALLETRIESCSHGQDFLHIYVDGEVVVGHGLLCDCGSQESSYLTKASFTTILDDCEEELAAGEAFEAEEVFV